LTSQEFSATIVDDSSIPVREETYKMSITEAAQTVPAGIWKSDPVHSSVGFAVQHMGVNPFRGTLSSFEAVLAGDQLVGSAAVGSIQTADENLTGHLLSPEFFDAERNPELRFESTEIRRDGDEVVVDGQLTLKGVTRPVELRGAVTEPVDDPYGKRRLGLELETTIDRTDFGIDWNAELPSGGEVLANNVELTARLELVQEA
jgi:polyisoprenoid-binding protein YceI